MFLPGRYKFFATSNVKRDVIQLRLHLPGSIGAPFVLTGDYFLGYVVFGGAYDCMFITFDKAKGDIHQISFINETEDELYKFPISHGNNIFYKIVEADCTIKGMRSIS